MTCLPGAGALAAARRRRAGWPAARRRARAPGVRRPGGTGLPGPAAAAVAAAAPAAAPPGAASPSAACRRSTARRSARAPTARWRGWCSSGRSSRILSACRSLAAARCDLPSPACTRFSAPANSAIMRSNGSVERRAAADQHVVMPGRMRERGSDSRTTSRSRRRTRLRSTALPTFFETVKPTAHGPHRRARAPAARMRAAGALEPAAAAGNPPVASAAPWRCGRARAALRRSAACARARGAPRAPCGRPWSPCGRESRAGACAPVCSVDRSVSRVCSPLVAACRRWSDERRRMKLALKPASSCRRSKFGRLIREAVASKSMRPAAGRCRDHDSASKSSEMARAASHACDRPHAAGMLVISVRFADAGHP